VLIILKNPYGCRWSRRFNGNETLKKSIQKFFGSIIFFFELYCK